MNLPDTILSAPWQVMALLGFLLVFGKALVAAPWGRLKDPTRLNVFLYADYLPYYVLMAWSEAVMSGMAITLLVVYRPEWVGTFDDQRYLRKKK